MGENVKHVAIVAGEMSGDLLGAGLMDALRQRFPNARFSGIGGPQMLARGFESHYSMDRLAVMGLVEVLGRLPELLRIRKSLRERYLAERPDVFIGIDSPDFNLGLELALRRGGVKTVHYVSPSIWAWRPERVHKIREAVEHVLCLLPFEPAFYEKAAVPATFVGHPLADMLPVESEQRVARQTLGLPEDGFVVALLPGSRGTELKFLAEPMIRAARLCLQRFPDLQFVAPMVNGRRQQQFEAVLNRIDPDLPVRLVSGRSREVMAAADVVLLASGTATLEAMLLKRPMVVAYRMAWLTVKLLRPKISLKHFSLPNLLAGEALVPELLQEDCTAEKLAEAVLSWLEHPERGEALRARFTAMHQALRQNANVRAAEVVAGLAEGVKP
ncbi:MAG: lipid-A-disaccharide synthase [Gammaproteobacteria bacterium]|nr:lipid-A-disaccharide synthase [Gammaproteobacteria bacterium]